ncbi:MAG TPA: TGS domain-containing protein [Planctomycetota bacterium]|nr:TGS domain-containing protein [Planctomycetota bacterium]
MPANLTPQYHKAEEIYKQAKTSAEKIAALEEMLRVMPKHKGTDHLQADLKRRIAKLRDEDAKPKGKKAAFDPFRVDKGGAGQVVLLGAPNAGKSAIVARVSNAATSATPFPFATQGPVPGMMAFEDVQVQLVDLPPITADFLPSGMLGLIKSADGALLVADLSSDGILEEVDTIVKTLEASRIRLDDPQRRREPARNGGEGSAAGQVAEPEIELEMLVTAVPTLFLANKSDAPGAGERLDLVREYFGEKFEPIVISAETGAGFEGFPKAVFDLLERIRVYSKEPGKQQDLSSPFVLKRGQTVLDLAARIHRDFPDHLRQARVWGSARFDGQAVQRDHVLADRDIVELQVDI